MKNRTFGFTLNSILFLTIVILLSSCRGSKDLTYFRDASNNKSITGSPAPITPYKIQIHDNLYVSIITANMEMNDLYNPATIGSQRAINNVWQNLPGQYTQGYLVEPDGTVNLPSIGRIPVAGLNFQEAEAKIKAKAQEYLKEVTAKVRLLNFKVTVVGEVFNPGVYFNYNPEFTVFDAIGSAGGAKNTSKLEEVLVLRRTKTGTQEYILNLQSANVLKSPGYLLEPNDVVVIQPSRYKNVEMRMPLYTLGLATITTLLLVVNFVQDNNNN